MQQQQTEAVRQLREMNSLRLQLAVERRRNAGDETHGAEDDSPEESLYMQIKELEEERLARPLGDFRISDLGAEEDLN